MDTDYNFDSTTSILVTVLASSFLGVAEGCFRKSPSRPSGSEREPDTVIIDRPDEEEPYTPMSTPSVLFPCTHEERHLARCLNGGQCFVVETGSVGCNCPEEFHGKRCEQLYVSLHSMEMQKAGFTLGIISVLVLFLLVALVTFYVILKYKKRQKQEEDEKEDLEGVQLTADAASSNGVNAIESQTNVPVNQPKSITPTVWFAVEKSPSPQHDLTTNSSPPPSEENHRPLEFDHLSGSLRKAKAYNRASIIDFIDDDD